MNEYINHEDELKIRFTAWLRTLVKRARIDYLRSKKKENLEVPLSEIANSANFTYEVIFIPAKIDIEKGEYEFEREDVSRAFSLLNITRRKVLLMLFVEGMTPKEIAEELGCSVRMVNKIRRQALDILRGILGGEN